MHKETLKGLKLLLLTLSFALVGILAFIMGIPAHKIISGICAIIVLLCAFEVWLASLRI